MNEICIISTIKAPLNETVMFVNYHLNIGVDEIIIFLDDPNDEAADYLQGYRRVTCIKCDDVYWKQCGSPRFPALEDRQVNNINNGMVLARQKGFEWAIIIDNDELVYPEGNLKSILSESKADVVRFEIHEAVSEEEHYDNIFSPTLFKKPSGSWKARLAQLLGCKRAFFEGRYFRGHLDSKVAVRLDVDIKKMGVHGPASAGPAVIEKNTRRIKLLHYDCVGMNSWKRKWLSRLDPSSVKGLGYNRKQQLKIFSAACNGSEDELRKLYNNVYIIPQHEQMVLSMLNMLARIRLNRELFEHLE